MRRTGPTRPVHPPGRENNSPTHANKISPKQRRRTNLQQMAKSQRLPRRAKLLASLDQNSWVLQNKPKKKLSSLKKLRLHLHCSSATDATLSLSLSGQKPKFPRTERWRNSIPSDAATGKSSQIWRFVVLCIWAYCCFKRWKRSGDWKKKCFTEWRAQTDQWHH